MIKQISVEEVKKAIDAKEEMVLLDVRTVGEFARGKIDSSINLPVDEVAEKIQTVAPNKTKTIYVYCLSGSRSVYAVEVMDQLGYKNTYDMANGLLAWRAKGYSVV